MIRRKRGEVINDREQAVLLMEKKIKSSDIDVLFIESNSLSSLIDADLRIFLSGDLSREKSSSKKARELAT
jgi:hypothetical protein